MFRLTVSGFQSIVVGEAWRSRVAEAVYLALGQEAKGVSFAIQGHLYSLHLPAMPHFLELLKAPKTVPPAGDQSMHRA